MKLLFIENRYKTYFYVPIAKQLEKDGHEVVWLIQNREFIPKMRSKICVIPYPKKGKSIAQKDGEIEDLIKSDRQFNHFGRNNVIHFYYYYYEIKKLMDEESPSIVFGESTAFHELLTILYCKRKGVLYLNPSTCRYPVGRFSFYKNDTLIPYSGSGELLGQEEGLKIVNQIVQRSATPDYMRLVPPAKISQLQDKLLKIKSFAQGEKYNTPDPRIKFRVEKEKKKLIAAWDQVSVTNINEIKGFTVLYPLQMQPEANIDVWGKKYRDQKELIRNLANNLPEGVKLVVKPNPKSKYEISRELLNLVKERSNIIPLHHKVQMDPVFAKVDAVITVTGTIAIECILAHKPVMTLIKTLNNDIRTCIHINSVQKDLKKVVNDLRESPPEKLSNKEKIHFINLLNSTSFEGKVSDPLTDTSCISDSNVQKMVEAFRYIINAS